MHRHMGMKVLFGLGMAAGAGMLLHRMSERECCAGAGVEAGAQPGHFSRFGHGEHSEHSERHGWQRRWAGGFPPIFEEWHQQAHAQEKAKSQGQAQTPPPAEPTQS